MVAYKEFQGKTLDDAISEACEYFGVAREKLEIDIVSDAKSGIFGLVGVKKATVRAGRVDLPGAVDALLAESAPADAPADTPGGIQAKKPAARKQTQETRHAEHRTPPPGKSGKKTADVRGREDEAAAAACEDAPADTLCCPRENLPDFDLANCDQDRLFAVVKDVVLRLVRPIAGDVPCAVTIAGSRVRAVLDCGDAVGLLVGRDGQTLAAVQSLASRIIARQIGGTVRLHVDAGKYRERQDDALKDLALSLAQRVKEIGRPLSTRPLTAYQRRLVHLSLEHDEAVQTHSKGEGAQRKVTISLRRGNGKSEPESGAESVEGRPAKRGDAKEGRRGQKARRPRPDTAGAEGRPSGVDDANAP